MPEQERDSEATFFATFMFFVTALVGVGGVALAFSHNEQAGNGLIAAAIAFGLLTNALMRK